MSFQWNWREVAYLMNTAQRYTHKQDKISVFTNAFRHIEQKALSYLNQHGQAPVKELKELIRDFRLSFPQHGREEGLNYFDDLIENFLDCKTLPEFTHREHAYAAILKEDHEGIPRPPRKEQKPKGVEKAFDSFNPKSSVYKPIRAQELRNVILLLAEFPKAKVEAEKQLQTTLKEKN